MITRLQKLIVFAAETGALTSYVSSKLKNVGDSEKPKSGKSPKEIKEEYDKADKPTKQKLILEYAPHPKESDLATISVPLGDNTLTMKVLKKPVEINSGTAYSFFPNPAPATLQALANSWFKDRGGMVLPTNKIIKTIQQETKKDNTNVDIKPLSGTGYVDPRTKKFIDQETLVREMGVGNTGAGLAFSKQVQEKLKDSPDKLHYIGGKAIVQPFSEEDYIYFAGDWQKAVSPSGETKAHEGAVKGHYTEYELLIAYLTLDQATLTNKDGTSKSVSIKQILNDPVLYSAISDHKGYREYSTSHLT